MNTGRLTFALSAATLLFSIHLPSAWSQVPPPPDGKEALSDRYPGRAYSPYAGRGLPSRVFWGDTHLHSDMSMDAGAFGNRLGLDEAYRFARGEEVTTSTGLKAKLSRPFDFLVVADHSDNMGFFPDLFDGKPHILNEPTGRDWYDRITAGEGVGVALELIGLFSQGEFPEGMIYWPNSAPYKSAWQGTVAAAERYKLPAVGNTVDVENANWTNTIGAAELGAVWTDPDFNPGQKAFYYARVIEIPTPRWSTYDAFRFGIALPEGAPTSTQERAYTSPIWYTP